MSRSYEYSYALEQAARQAIYNERVSATTERFYRRYVEQFEQMQREGYAAYIPEEMSRLQSDLAQIRNLLITDPTEARDLSFEVGSYIRSLNSLADSAVVQFDRAERIRVEAKREQQKQTQNALLDEYYRRISEVSPAVVHFAQSELSDLRAKIESGTNISSNEFQHQLTEVIQRAKQKAAEWKGHTFKSHKKAEIVSRIDEVQASISSEKIEDREKAEQFLAHLQSLKSSIADGSQSAESVEKQISEIESNVDDVLITEEIRRQTVKAIIKQLKIQEFTVEKPQIFDNAGESFVKITAQRPSGKRAVCKIDLQGKIRYKFDNYEGMTCLKDIEKFNVDLDKIYSVKLSDERVLWSNPDRLTKDADSAPSGTLERGHQ